MNESSRCLVRIAVAIGSDDDAALREAFAAAVHATDVTAVDEAVLQSYLFVGYPRVLNAMRVWREYAPAVDGEPDTGGLQEWNVRGREVFERVYGGQHAKLLENVAALHPELADWMVTEGYGKVLGRSGLTLQVRELCVVALLATQDAIPQLYSHLRGALNVGVAENDVEETLVLALSRASGERGMRAREAWETVRNRRGG